MNAKELFDLAFDKRREPRSYEYKNGVMAILRYKIDGANFAGCPYSVGSASADAWFSGVDEGSRIVAANLTIKIQPTARPRLNLQD